MVRRQAFRKRSGFFGRWKGVSSDQVGHARKKLREDAKNVSRTFPGACSNKAHPQTPRMQDICELQYLEANPVTMDHNSEDRVPAWG